MPVPMFFLHSGLRSCLPRVTSVEAVSASVGLARVGVARPGVHWPGLAEFVMSARASAEARMPEEPGDGHESGHGEDMCYGTGTGTARARRYAGIGTGTLWAVPDGVRQWHCFVLSSPAGPSIDEALKRRRLCLEYPLDASFPACLWASWQFGTTIVIPAGSSALALPLAPALALALASPFMGMYASARAHFEGCHAR